MMFITSVGYDSNSEFCVCGFVDYSLPSLNREGAPEANSMLK